MTIAEYIDHLADERIIRPNTVANWHTACRNFALSVGDREIAEVCKRDIRQWVDALRSQHITSNTANAYMRCLRSVWNKAAEEYGLASPNPFRHAMIKPEETVKRALGEFQIRQLMKMELTRKEAWARDVFLLAYSLNGIAPVDLWNLRKKDICGRKLTYRRMKTGKLIHVSLSPYAVSLLTKLGFAAEARRPFRREQWVVNKWLRRIGRKMDLPFSLTLYCARHTWATVAQRIGVPTSVISSKMGHSDEKTTEVYLAGVETPVLDMWEMRIQEALFGHMEDAGNARKSQ